MFDNVTWKGWNKNIKISFEENFLAFVVSGHLPRDKQEENRTLSYERERESDKEI